MAILLIPVLAVFTVLVMMAMQKANSQWARPLLVALAAGLSKVWFVGAKASDAVLSIERSISVTLGNAVLAAQQPVAKWLIGIRLTLNGTVYAASAAVVATSQAIVNLVDVVLPRAIDAAATHTIVKLRPITAPAVAAAKVTVPRIQTRVKVLDKRTAATVAALAATVKALHHSIAVDIPGTVSGDIAGLRDYVNKRADSLAKRIEGIKGRAAAVLGIGGLLALLVKADMGWLKCSRVNQLGKRACGMDKGLLDALLADTLLIAGTLSIVEFAKAEQKVIEELSGQMRAFWRVT